MDGILLVSNSINAASILLFIVIMIIVIGLTSVIVSVRKKKKARDKMVIELFQDTGSEGEE